MPSKTCLVQFRIPRFGNGGVLPTLALPLLLALLVGGCADAEPGDIRGEWSSEEEVRGDTTIVRTLSGSVWGDTMVLVPEVEIGVLDGDDAYILGNVRSIAVSPEGRVYGADGQAAVVRVYGPDGDHLHTIGRQGEGPGEFSQPDGVRVRSDGRVVVRDQQNARYSVFSPDGDFEASWPLPGGFSTSAPFHLDLEDQVYHPTIRNLGSSMDDWEQVLVRYDPEGQAVDTIAVPSLDWEPTYLEATSGGGRSRVGVPFMPSESWTMEPSGAILLGVSDTYSFDRIDTDGSVLRIERDVAPAPVAPGERDQARENVMSQMRGMDPNWRWQGPAIPDVKPAFGTLLAGTDGTMWVRRLTPAVEVDNPDWSPDDPDAQPRTRWRTPTVFDVFDEGGQYLGPVRVPEGFSFGATPVLTREEVWAVATHPELGYPQIVRYRLEPIS